MRPEEQQYRFAFQGLQRFGLGANPFLDFKRWCRLPIQTEKMDIFLDAGPNGGSAELFQLSLKKADGFAAVAARVQDMRLHFNRRAQSDRQMLFGVEIPLFQR